MEHSEGLWIIWNTLEQFEVDWISMVLGAQAHCTLKTILDTLEYFRALLQRTLLNS